ncbi:MAG: alpha/beta hydrolase fold domain-containing protein [Planctomycetota bacterium]|jgi:acetyl esterase/lipase
MNILKLTLVVSFIVVLSGFSTASQKTHPRLTHADVSYGTHERNALDFWQAEGEGPRPLVVFIHGGGWTTGGKSRSFKKNKPFLDKGISCAAINYRLTSHAPLPAPVHDAARAIQFLRFKAKEWNINKDRIGLTGGSAGGCTSLWLLLHDDLADPDNEDPVKRESTKITAAAVGNAQASLDPSVIKEWLGPNVLRHRMIWTCVGEKNMAAALKNYEKHKKTYFEFSPYNHMKKGSPPLLMTYSHPADLPSKSANHGIHHPQYGVKMKEKADSLDVECHVIIKGDSTSEKYKGTTDFLIDKLLEK